VDSDRNARLADFGLVSFLNNATSVAASLTGDSGGGTLRYMAPEIIDPKNAAEANGTSLDRSPSDVYALTITIWEVLRYITSQCRVPY
jgi:serine/threonine protein kinase